MSSNSEPLTRDEAVERITDLDPDWDLSGPFPGEDENEEAR